MIDYRTFRNSDPPKILELWNRQVGLSRGFGYLASCDNLENYLFSKPYFDRNGLILAFDGERLVGMCHAGFGSDEGQSGLDYSQGVLCMLLVDPEYRRQGIGSELLKKGQAYLQSKGSKVLYAGPLHPLNPFYLGMYGGSELPGILESDADMTSFIVKRGFKPVDTCYVYQIILDDLDRIEDHRLPLLRRRVDIHAEPLPLPFTWWHACTMGPHFTLRYEMVDRETQTTIGMTWVWQMETFGRAWDAPTVGITQFSIDESYRRQGYGKLLLFSILKHLKEHEIVRVEIQTMERNMPARRLYEAIGFQHVDTGHIYRLSTDEPTASAFGTGVEHTEVVDPVILSSTVKQPVSAD